jgi:hypothetical protein
MPFNEVVWPVLILLVVLVGVWRARSFYARLGLALEWVSVNISKPLAIALRLLAALLIGFVLLYFLVNSVQLLLLKPAVFHRCLPESQMPERIVKCILGDPYKYIKRSSSLKKRTVRHSEHAPNAALPP